MPSTSSRRSAFTELTTRPTLPESISGNSTAATTRPGAGPGAGSRHVVALDGLRGIAALGVVLYHSELGARFGLFTQGWMAVDFFLCLGGYVIGLAYDKRIVAGMAFGDFARARLIRLYAMVFVGGVLAY